MKLASSSEKLTNFYQKFITLMDSRTLLWKMMGSELHVVDGLPYPLRIAPNLGVHFSDRSSTTQRQNEHQKKFHLRDSEL